MLGGLKKDGSEGNEESVIIVVKDNFLVDVKLQRSCCG